MAQVGFSFFAVLTSSFLISTVLGNETAHANRTRKTTPRWRFSREIASYSNVNKHIESEEVQRQSWLSTIEINSLECMLAYFVGIVYASTRFCQGISPAVIITFWNASQCILSSIRSKHYVSSNLIQFSIISKCTVKFVRIHLARSDMHVDYVPTDDGCIL